MIASMPRADNFQELNHNCDAAPGLCRVETAKQGEDRLIHVHGCLYLTKAMDNGLEVLQDLSFGQFADTFNPLRNAGFHLLPALRGMRTDQRITHAQSGRSRIEIALLPQRLSTPIT